MKYLFILLGVLSANTALGDGYIVKYRNNLSAARLESPFLRVVSHHVPGRFYVVDLDTRHQRELVTQLRMQKNIEYVVPDIKIELSRLHPSVQGLQYQWAVEKVQAAQAWQRAGNKGSRQVVVAVIDTGTDYRHVSLSPNMVKGYNFIENNEDPMDIVSYGFPGHGTHCTGIIGATGLREGGTTGISPEVSLMPLRFIDDEGGLVSNAIRAIDFAIDKKVQVISASWGNTMTREEAKPLLEAISRAEKVGIVFVTAASNSGSNNDISEVYPANAGLSNTISVAATDQEDGRPAWSNFGRAQVHLSAPGNWILSTLPGNRYADMDGTSMAAPLVAGLVALIKAQDPGLNPQQIRSLLQATGDTVKVETACNCRVNAFKAIDQIIAKKMFLSPNALTLKKGEEVPFEAVYGQGPITYTTNDSTIAVIDSRGVLKSLKEGAVVVTATDTRGTSISSHTIWVK